MMPTVLRGRVSVEFGELPPEPGLGIAVGVLILLLLSGTVDRDIESAVAAGEAKFEPIRATRAEFYSFFLFSITGLMPSRLAVKSYST